MTLLVWVQMGPEQPSPNFYSSHSHTNSSPSVPAGLFDLACFITQYSAQLVLDSGVQRVQKQLNSMYQLSVMASDQTGTFSYFQNGSTTTKMIFGAFTQMKKVKSYNTNNSLSMHKNVDLVSQRGPQHNSFSGKSLRDASAK